MPYISLESGVIHLDAEITYSNTVDFLATFRAMEAHEKVSEIVVHVTCHGGALMPSIATVQALKCCHKPLRTVGAGYVASAAVAVLAAGRRGRRVMYEGTNVVVHEPKRFTEISAKNMPLAYWTREAENFERMAASYYLMLARCSGRDGRFWEDLLKNKPDLVLSDAEVIEYGLVDEILPL